MERLRLWCFDFFPSTINLMPLTLPDVIAQLKAARARIARPVDHWELRAGEYRALCAEVTVRELTLLKPGNVSEGDWDYRVNALSDLIVTELFDGERVGLAIRLRRATQGQMEVIAGPAPGIFGLDTVKEWVEAGVGGDSTGKQTDDRDTGRESMEIAKRVWWAMFTGRSSRSHDKIRAYLTEQQFKLIEENYQNLLGAWRNALMAKARRHWREYVAMAAKGHTIEAPF